MSRRFLALTTLASLLALGGCQKQTEPGLSATAGSTAASAPATDGSGSTVSATSTAQDAYLLAATGNGFSTGPMMSAHTVYVFFDTTCPHCAHLWQAAQTVNTQLKVVWIPVGFLRPQSLPQGATILSAADPVAAMNENEASLVNNGKGIAVAATPNEDALAKVRANTSLFKQFHSDSVPLIVYRNAKTGEVGQQAGAATGPELLALAGI